MYIEALTFVCVISASPYNLLSDESVSTDGG